MTTITQQQRELLELAVNWCTGRASIAEAARVVEAGNFLRQYIKQSPAQAPVLQATDYEAHQKNGLAWAVNCWNQEVKNRPLINVHRRTLDDTWRQVIRYFGGNPDNLIGPSHDALMVAEPKRPENCGTGHCSCIECVMPGGEAAPPRHEQGAMKTDNGTFIDFKLIEPEDRDRIADAAIAVALLADGGHILPTDDANTEAASALETLCAAVRDVELPQ